MYMRRSSKWDYRGCGIRPRDQDSACECARAMMDGCACADLLTIAACAQVS